MAEPLFTVEAGLAYILDMPAHELPQVLYSVSGNDNLLGTKVGHVTSSPAGYLPGNPRVRLELHFQHGSSTR